MFATEMRDLPHCTQSKLFHYIKHYIYISLNPPSYSEIDSSPNVVIVKGLQEKDEKDQLLLLYERYRLRQELYRKNTLTLDEIKNKWDLETEKADQNPDLLFSSVDFLGMYTLLPQIKEDMDGCTDKTVINELHSQQTCYKNFRKTFLEAKSAILHHLSEQRSKKVLLDEIKKLDWKDYDSQEDFQSFYDNLLRNDKYKDYLPSLVVNPNDSLQWTLSDTVQLQLKTLIGDQCRSRFKQIKIRGVDQMFLNIYQEIVRDTPLMSLCKFSDRDLLHQVCETYKPQLRILSREKFQIVKGFIPWSMRHKTSEIEHQFCESIHKSWLFIEYKPGCFDAHNDLISSFDKFKNKINCIVGNCADRENNSCCIM